MLNHGVGEAPAEDDLEKQATSSGSNCDFVLSSCDEDRNLTRNMSSSFALAPQAFLHLSVSHVHTGGLSNILWRVRGEKRSSSSGSCLPDLPAHRRVWANVLQVAVGRNSPPRRKHATMTVIIMLEIVARNRGLVVLPEDLEFILQAVICGEPW